MAIEPLTVAHMPDSYPEIRRTVGECLLDASQRLRMSASGMHDAMVACAGDVRLALMTHSPVRVAHAKRRAVGCPFGRPCDAFDLILADARASILDVEWLAARNNLRFQFGRYN